MQAMIEQAGTAPKLLFSHAKVRRDRPAFRKKDLGIWQTWSWREMADQVRDMAVGLAELGLERGDRIAIIGANRPQLYWAFDAIQAIGGVPVPLYAESAAEEMRFVLGHADVKLAICEDQEQIDKVLSVMDRVASLEQLVYEDPRGLRHYDQPFIHSLESMRAQGHRRDQADPSFLDSEVAKGKGDDIAILAYTSGTTGDPKGVLLSFDNLLRSARLAVEMESLSEHEEILAYLPMAWIGDHFFSVAQQHIAGFTVNCPESSDTVMLDLKDIGPTFLLAPPVIFENFLTQIRIRMEDAGWLKRKLFDFFMTVAGRVGVDILEGRPVPSGDRILYAMGGFLLYGPLKNNLGFSRTRIAYTGGAPLGEEVFNFYRSIGLNLKQLYGQTESSAYTCIQRDGDVKADTVGPPCPGVELKIAKDGEIIFRSPGNFVGYFKNEEATKETLDGDGWVHTGDAGIIDDDGHLKVIDRAKDVGQLSDGTLFAPQYIENKLKFHPFIREAVAHGAGHDHVACFINIDLEAVSNWAERSGLSYTNYTDLASRDQVYDLIKQCIEDVNRSLARDSAMRGSQIRRFLLLHKELDADDGELTRTRKVRRRIIAERYAPLIEALYSESNEIAFKSEVTFEDGRRGTLAANLKIREADIFASGADARQAA